MKVVFQRSLAVIQLLILFALLSGCVKKPQKDGFVEHWEAKASKSEGFSPTPLKRKVEYSKTIVKTGDEESETKQQQKKLPTLKVGALRMYNTNIVAVVRALARIANQNIIFSSSIPGVNEGTKDDKSMLVNIDVRDAAWDEIFKNLLSSSGLTYKIDGDIITVLKFEDLEAQNKISAEKTKTELELKNKKKTEDFVTAKVQINYSDLTGINNTVAQLCGSSKTMSQDKTASTTIKDSGGGVGRSSEYTVERTGQTTPNASSSPMLYSGRQPGQLVCSVIPDEHSNSLILQGPPEDIKKVVTLIDTLDVPPTQVKLKTFIVETSKSTAQQLGIQWGGLLKQTYFQLSPGQAGTSSSTSVGNNSGSTSSLNTASYPATSSTISSGNTMSTAGTTGNTMSTAGTTSPITTMSTGSNTNTSSSSLTNALSPIFGGSTSGQGFAINNPASLTSAATGLGASGTALNFLFGKIGQNVLEAQLTALAADSKVNILSNPTITTMENQQASIEDGKDIPYSTTSNNGTNVQWVHATLKVEVTPHVVDGVNLRMKIMVKDDQVDEDQTNWVAGNPPIYKRETKSNLVIEDGDTIVISGLTRTTNTKIGSGVPFLSDIPGLGWAFKSKSNSYEKTQLLIFITPTVLKEKPVENVPVATTAVVKDNGIAKDN